MSKDPIRFDDGTNLYAYVGNDPINNIDPTGKSTTTLAVCGAIIAYVVIDGVLREVRKTQCKDSIDSEDLNREEKEGVCDKEANKASFLENAGKAIKGAIK